MLTKEIVEGLLYNTHHRDILIKCLTSMHVLNGTDRNWQPVQHTEFHFLNDFQTPYFLMIVDKLIHVYLIGNRGKNRSYYILDIEGNNTDLLNLPKSELVNYIKEQSKETSKLYLPELFGSRIVFIKPDYINNLLGNDDVYIFNKQSLDNNIFRKGVWSTGHDVYSVNQPEYELETTTILREILKDVE